MSSVFDIPPDKIYIAQQAALMRLQLFITGETHRLVSEVGNSFLPTLRRAGETTFASNDLRRVSGQIDRAWKSFIAQYNQLLATGMHIAAALPFGALAVQHETLVLPVAEEAQATPQHVPAALVYMFGREIGALVQMASNRGFEGVRSFEEHTVFSEQAPRAPDGVFTPQLDEIVKAAYRRVYDDNVKLSERIWNLDNGSRERMQTILYGALSKGLSAWDTAELMEQFLGAGADCPRWTHQRLYGLTKSDIASGDSTGLMRGAECRGQGVAYNALRLARTEIQAVHHIANDALMAQIPWILEEQINLSPAHAEVDECDEVAEGGRDGKGIYPKGETTLPLHPHCMCFKTSVTMDDDEFIGKLRGWLGGDTWGEMDQYATMLGGSVLTSLAETSVAILLDYWAWEAGEALGALFWELAGSTAPVT